MMRLVRSLRSREQKPKIFLTFLIFLGGGWGGADKKWKGNFWFCFAASVSEKSNHTITFLFAFFSNLTATEALPYPCSVVALIFANHTQPPPHSPLASLALAASALRAFA